METAGICTRLRESRDKMLDRLRCLSERAKGSSWGLKALLVFLHVLFVGTAFLLDPTLARKTKEEPWYIAIYLVLLLATLVQYFVTSGSSPGYVIDAMRVRNETHATYVNASRLSKKDNLLQKMEACLLLRIVISWGDKIQEQLLPCGHR